MQISYQQQDKNSSFLFWQWFFMSVTSKLDSSVDEDRLTMQSLFVQSVASFPPSPFPFSPFLSKTTSTFFVHDHLHWSRDDKGNNEPSNPDGNNQLLHSPHYYFVNVVLLSWGKIVSTRYPSILTTQCWQFLFIWFCFLVSEENSMTNLQYPAKKLSSLRARCKLISAAPDLWTFLCLLQRLVFEEQPNLCEGSTTVHQLQCFSKSTSIRTSHNPNPDKSM